MPLLAAQEAEPPKPTIPEGLPVGQEDEAELHPQRAVLHRFRDNQCDIWRLGGVVGQFGLRDGIFAWRVAQASVPPPDWELSRRFTELPDKETLEAKLGKHRDQVAVVGGGYGSGGRG